MRLRDFHIAGTTNVCQLLSIYTREAEITKKVTLKN